MLSERFAGEETRQGEIALLRRCVARLGEVQRVECCRLTELVALGLPSYELATLSSAARQIACDTEVLMTGRAGGLTLAEAAAFKAAMPAVDAACKRLAALGIPTSVEHGDFRFGNILRIDSAGEFRLIDWGSASLSHPFFSLAQLLDEEEYPGLEVQAAAMRQEVADAYLEAWRGTTNDAGLREALALARLLMPIARASERYSRLLPSLASPEGWRFSVSFWVRRFLRQIAAGLPR